VNTASVILVRFCIIVHDDDHVDRWDFVSELRPPTCLLFIPQVIYVHGEQWWNDIDKESSWFVYQSSPVLLQAESSSSDAGGSGQGNDEFFLTKYFFHTWKCSLTSCKILWHIADGFTSPPKEGVLRIFIAVKNPSPSAGFETVNVGSSDKHASH
jgi:hypothetical protein